MNDVDRRLLELLRQDASLPLKTLAAAVSLSTSSVRERIMRMLADGTIRRYTVELSPSLTRVTTILLLRLEQTPAPQIVGAVVAMPEVVRCYSLSGEIDLLVELAAAETAVVNAARDRIALLPGVAGATTSLVLNHDKTPD